MLSVILVVLFLLWAVIGGLLTYRLNKKLKRKHPNKTSLELKKNLGNSDKKRLKRHVLQMLTLLIIVIF